MSKLIHIIKYHANKEYKNKFDRKVQKATFNAKFNILL
jgi:hypothetical protein